MKHLADFQTLYRWHESLYSFTFPLKLMGADFGRRMIVVRSQDEKLLLFSPLELGPALTAELRELGEIAALVFPTCFHDTGAARAASSLPSATIYATAGLEKHLASAQPIDALHERWGDLLSWQLIEGMPKINEVVFFHPSSKTLLPSDLLFNFTPEFSRWTRMLARMSGAYPEVQPTRLFRSFIKDPLAAKQSVEKVLRCDFDRALPSHADAIGSERAREGLEAFVARSGGALAK